MSNLSVFNFESNEVRVVLVNGEPWFVAKDTCDILGISNVSQALSRLDDDERSTIILNEGINAGNPNTNIISESGMYGLVLSSRKPEAKPFRKWITSEVLPSIRKTGSYSLLQTPGQPKLPVHVVALEKAKVIRDIQDILSYDNPRIAQFLIDYTISDIMSNAKPDSTKLRGVVEIAEEMGLPVSLKNRGALGKFVKARVGSSLKEESRLVNGTMRLVACYPDSAEVREAIAEFFS